MCDVYSIYAVGCNVDVMGNEAAERTAKATVEIKCFIQIRWDRSTCEWLFDDIKKQGSQDSVAHYFDCTFYWWGPLRLLFKYGAGFSPVDYFSRGISDTECTRLWLIVLLVTQYLFGCFQPNEHFCLELIISYSRTIIQCLLVTWGQCLYFLSFSGHWQMHLFRDVSLWYSSRSCLTRGHYRVITQHYQTFLSFNLSCWYFLYSFRKYYVCLCQYSIGVVFHRLLRFGCC